MRTDFVKCVPAAVKALSIEPLLADIPTIGEHLDGIDWVIVGGESGPHAPPMHPDWVRRIRDETTRRSGSKWREFPKILSGN